MKLVHFLLVNDVMTTYHNKQRVWQAFLGMHPKIMGWTT